LALVPVRAEAPVLAQALQPQGLVPARMQALTLVLVPPLA